MDSNNATTNDQSRFSTDAVAEVLSAANEQYRDRQTFQTRLAGSIADAQYFLQIYNASRSIENQNNLIAATQRLSALLESGVSA